MSSTEQKSITLAEIAELVGGKMTGDAGLRICSVAPINAAKAGDITFVANPKYIAALESTAASAVIVHPELGYDGDKPRIETANPYLAFAKVLTFLSVQKPLSQGVSAAAFVAQSAQLGSDVTVSHGCYIGENVRVGKGSYLHPGTVLYDNVSIGDDCLLHSGTVIRENCRVGNRVILQPNAVIGSDGFGFAPDGDKYFKIPQVGIVVLEDDVEIGSCSCIDRAAMGQTLIKKGTKIDNLVQIGHNVEVGENTVMASNTAIAGSTIIGDHCTFGGQSGAVGHIKIGNNVTVVGRGGVSGDVEDNQYVAGFPSMPHNEWRKASLVFGKLPDMRKEIKRLSKKIEKLEDRLKES